MLQIVVVHVIKKSYMKLFKILSNPYTIIIVFLLLMISGEQTGGFYIIYIFTALPHAGIHAILAVGGMIILLFNYHVRNKAFVSFFLNIIGLAFLVLSLYLFFANDPSHYNQATFEQTVPLFTFILFGFLVLCSVLHNFIHLPKTFTTK